MKARYDLEWRSLSEYEDYYKLSNYGDIYSYDRIITCSDGRFLPRRGRLLRPQLNEVTGYLHVGLHKDKISKTITIHTMVGRLYVPGWKPGLVINHMDTDKTNNYYKNLEWVTQAKNIEHSVINGLNPTGDRIFLSKIKESDLPVILKLSQSGLKTSQIAAKYSVSFSTIWSIINNKSWKRELQKISQ